MFTFGIDGVELYDGTQEIGDTTSIALQGTPFRGGVKFNPSTGMLFTPHAGFAEVYLYDMSGAMRMGVSGNVTAGMSEISLDRELLPKGLYVVKVKFDGKLMQKSVFRN
jgi:hypothetical protein